MSCPVPVTGLVSLPVQMYRKSYCTTLGVSVGVGISKLLRFYILKGNALTGKLSCFVTGLGFFVGFFLPSNCYNCSALFL